MATALTNAYTGICIGGPLAGAELSAQGAIYTVIDAQDDFTEEGEAPDANVSYVGRGYYSYNPMAFTFMGAPVAAFIYQDINGGDALAQHVLDAYAKGVKKKRWYGA